MAVKKLCVWCMAVALTVYGNQVGAQNALLRVDPSPVVILGAAQSDTGQLFSTVVGAARLEDGRIIVADRGQHALQVFSTRGARVNRFGGKGAGPGEITYLREFHRCGDSVFVTDIGGRAVNVFTLSGRYVRTFQFAVHQPGYPPYRSACNARAEFVHYGWPQRPQSTPKEGTFRSPVPFWVSGADTVRGRPLGDFPGAERVVHTTANGTSAIAQLPFGAEASVAISRSHVFIGSSESDEIQAISLSDFRRTTFRVVLPPPLTVGQKDIAFFRELAIAATPAEARAGRGQQLSRTPFPKTFPRYARLLVDSRGLVWIQSYPSVQRSTVQWTVVSGMGVQLGSVSLPSALEVFEIGDDYVLGRYLDPDEMVPEVRVYRLHRTLESGKTVIPTGRPPSRRLNGAIAR